MPNPVYLIYIAVMAIFIFGFTSVAIKNRRKKREKAAVLKDGIQTQATITHAYSRSGSNTGFLNITVEFDYQTQSAKSHKGKSEAVINTMSINRYQPGEKLTVIYSKSQPEKVIADIPHPLLKK